MNISELIVKWKQELEQTKENIKKNILQKKINEAQKIIDLNILINQYEKDLEYSEEELKEYYKEEITELKEKIENETRELIFKILPNQKTSIILEIRSGEGGQEAELFAYELFEMYQKLSKKKTWQFRVLQTHMKESGGIKEASAEIIGNDINLWLAHECGVHCVKRVPKTEKKGRTHTSTATVAVLKIPTEIEINIKDKDLKIDVFRSSGPGGQSVNTTDSAVRITHIPSGIVVSQQDEKSQHLNKEKAMKVLRARLYEKEETKKNEEEAKTRRDAIGTAKRNEKIRTYHFTQNWINDVRIEKKSYDINQFMNGEDLEIFLNELIYKII